MVSKRTLVILAGVIWLIAGGNVLGVGIATLVDYYKHYYLAIIAGVFLAFYLLIFRRMANKQTKRIISYEEEKRPLYNVMDLKSFLIMIFMISLGVTIRLLGFNDVVAAFYPGLGLALFSAGIKYIINSINYPKIAIKEKEVSKKVKEAL